MDKLNKGCNNKCSNVNTDTSVHDRARTIGQFVNKAGNKKDKLFNLEVFQVGVWLWDATKSIVAVKEFLAELIVKKDASYNE